MDPLDDTLATQGFKLWPRFGFTEDLAKSTKAIMDLYATALHTGLFRSEAECIELGLLKNFSEMGRDLISSRDSKPAKATKYSVGSNNNMMLNELQWFFETKTYQRLVDYISQFTGPDLDMFMAKVIITMPKNHIPDYVQSAVFPMEKNPGGSLSPFIKEQFLKVFFFAHNPWHQDTVDYPDSDNHFFTSLISLTERTSGQAPLLVIPESTVIGKIKHPLEFKKEENNLVYKNADKIYRLPITEANLSTGDLIIWHSYMFHQVMPCAADVPAVSLRFNFAPSYRKMGIYDTKNIRPARRSALTKLTLRETATQ